MSPSIPPNSSSDGAADAGAVDEQSTDLRALVARLAGEFGVDAQVMSRVAAIFADVRERAPDLFVPASGALADALAFSVSASPEGGSTDAIHAALGEWALDAEGEPIERMRRDCLRFQSAMTRGAARLHAGDADKCAEVLIALQRFNFLQVALLASLSTRGQDEGGVVRTLPTPEYAAFMEIFRTTIEAHKQEEKQLGLLLIHIPRVEQVDRLLGLQKGEAYMLRVTRRMREGVLRKQDQLGRVSRDQLACLLPRIAGEGVGILAANKILAALESPIPIGDQTFVPDAVIGIAVYPDHGVDNQTLVRNGKLAVMAARGTTERTAVYDPSHIENEQLSMRYEARLRYVLEQGGLDLGFAPQLDTRSGRIGGLECLLRWKDDELGPVSENQAMATAESSGLVRELTWWVFNNALRQCAEFAKAGLDVPMSLKVTASSLQQPDFPEFVGRALRTWNVPPSRLVLEVHESALAGDIEQVKAMLVRLKAHGLRVGVAGIGTGAASLGNVAQLPLDEIKLSALFTVNMKRVAPYSKVVRAVVGLAKDLGIRVTAEGVLDAETALALSTLGCERIQGDYVSESLTAQEVIAFASKLTGLSLNPQS